METEMKEARQSPVPVGDVGEANNLPEILEEIVADNPDITVADIDAAINRVKERKINLIFLQSTSKETSQSYRYGCLDITQYSGVDPHDVQQIDVAANTRVSTLLKKYGDRLLAVDRAQKKTLLSIFSIGAYEEVESAVRVLVLKENRTRA